MKDPAFLFYDGDAARDVSHMTRLERGAYFDFIQAQRKFHGITMEQARKILGKDFSDVWASLEMILEEENGQYFIPWVRDSIDKRLKFNNKQKERIVNYWKKKKIPRNNHGNTVVIPKIEIEIENINNTKEGGVGGELPKKGAIIFSTLEELEQELLQSDEWIIKQAMRHNIDEETVRQYIHIFCMDQDLKDNTHRTLHEYRSHVTNWIGAELRKKPSSRLSSPGKALSYEELCDLSSKGQAKFSDYRKEGAAWIRK